MEPGLIDLDTGPGYLDLGLETYHATFCNILHPFYHMFQL